MALQDILRKIEQDAQEKIQEIEKSLLEEKNKISELTEKKISEIRKKLESEFQNKISQEKNMLTVQSNIEFKKKVLLEKNKIIDRAFSIAIEKIKNHKEYKNFLKNLIMNNISTGTEEIIVSENDRKKLGENFINEINSELKKRNLKGELKLLTGEISSGFIIKNGKKEINSTIEMLVNKKREELEPEVKKILFKDEKL
ncbi:MAG: V-type ATP synthase subunit E [Endomicrobiia bacterium]